MTTSKIRISTYIPANLKDAAEQAAQQEGRSLSNFLEQLIKRAVEKG